MLLEAGAQTIRPTAKSILELVCITLQSIQFAITIMMIGHLYAPWIDRFSKYVLACSGTRITAADSLVSFFTFSLGRAQIRTRRTGQTRQWSTFLFTVGKEQPFYPSPSLISSIGHPHNNNNNNNIQNRSITTYCYLNLAYLCHGLDYACYSVKQSYEMLR